MRFIILTCIYILFIIGCGSKDDSIEDVSTETISPPTQYEPISEEERFNKFKVLLNELNQRVAFKGGMTFFKYPYHDGEGTLYVVASKEWIERGTSSDQQSNIETLYNLWQSAGDSTKPLAVYVEDEEGEIFRGTSDF